MANLEFRKGNGIAFLAWLENDSHFVLLHDFVIGWSAFKRSIFDSLSKLLIFSDPDGPTSYQRQERHGTMGPSYKRSQGGNKIMLLKLLGFNYLRNHFQPTRQRYVDAFISGHFVRKSYKRPRQNDHLQKKLN